MEASRHISKGAAGSVIAVTVIAVFAASAYALQDGQGALAAAALAQEQPRAELSDTTDATSPQDPMATSTILEGRASFYGYRFKGRPTASGETFDPMGLTAAHRTLPFGSRVRVTNTSNGRTVIVRINDRGPFMRGRILDVSRGAAERLGMIRSGIAHVKVEVLP